MNNSLSSKSVEPLSDAQPSNVLKINSKLSMVSQNYSDEVKRFIAVFCFAKKNSQKADLLELVSSLTTKIDLEQPIFTQMQDAFDYARYLAYDFFIVKAYVEDRAIQSKNQNLCLQQNYLTDNMIHGCYPSIVDVRLYMKNPSFNTKIDE